MKTRRTDYLHGLKNPAGPNTTMGELLRRALNLERAQVVVSPATPAPQKRTPKTPVTPLPFEWSDDFEGAFEWSENNPSAALSTEDSRSATHSLKLSYAVGPTSASVHGPAVAEAIGGWRRGTLSLYYKPTNAPDDLFVYFYIGGTAFSVTLNFSTNQITGTTPAGFDVIDANPPSSAAWHLFELSVDFLSGRILYLALDGSRHSFGLAASGAANPNVVTMDLAASGLTAPVKVFVDDVHVSLFPS